MQLLKKSIKDQLQLEKKLKRVLKISKLLNNKSFEKILFSYFLVGRDEAIKDLLSEYLTNQTI